jgi:hypothetical protein
MAVIGALVVCSMPGLVLAGCSDDTSGPTPETEASIDGPSGRDVAPKDGPSGDVVDAASDGDAAAIDAMIDSGSDVAAEADSSDASPDVSDAGDAADARDALVDGSPVFDACCVVDAGIDVRDAGVDALDAAAADVHDAATTDGADATTADVVDATTADVVDATTADVVDATTADVADVTAVDVFDAAPDVYVCPTALEAYPQQYAAAYCYGVGNCCPGFDAGGFDLAACESRATSYGGWDNTIPSDAGTVACRGNMTIDEDAGVRCFAALRAYPCGTEVDASAFAALIRACEGVLGGTLPIDAGGCVSSFECVDGAYCKPGADGGGICTPLVGEGGTCWNDDNCRSATSGQPAFFCNGDFVASGVGACIPQQPDDADCAGWANPFDDQACASLQCGDQQTCGTPLINFLCGLGSPMDAGSD